MKIPRTESRAFTLIEVLIVVAVLVTLAVAFLSAALRRAQARSSRLNCTNNLKQNGLAFNTWAIDNHDRYPMGVSIANGGAMEAAITNLPLIFQVMSNELSTPKTLVCPADTMRTYATNFLSLASKNISYFAGLDATETNPACILAGDCNITNGMGVRAGILYAATNDPARWTPAPHKGSGNILFADGSVQQLATVRLREAIATTGFPTNRLLMP